ncbi:unnamed protein product [Fraxinus pennsylvanica]|uniref:Mei2-like C-terminal RNA recognition motif domain-containing protein n=1 Tax=Fraxinus pennsylvanica TaxID=56036 RepID=A0AAD2A6U8_9LAMI|nr:unnamed protein product [Fraxinus pennsylvanica]
MVVLSLFTPTFSCSNSYIPLNFFTSLQNFCVDSQFNLKAKGRINKVYCRKIQVVSLHCSPKILKCNRKSRYKQPVSPYDSEEDVDDEDTGGDVVDGDDDWISNHPLFSKNKLPVSSFPYIGSSSGLYASQGFRKPGLFQYLTTFDKHLETLLEDEMPNFLQAPSPNSCIKTSSSNNKRGSPPHSVGTSPNIRSSLLSQFPYGGRGATSNNGLIDRYRNRRVDSGSQAEDRRQYQLDLENITSKMLLAAINETHEGTYDFFYLPIDLKNKCNVRYAFINMVSPTHIITFHEV